jgi:hypothetical protein
VLCFTFARADWSSLLAGEHAKGATSAPLSMDVACKCIRNPKSYSLLFIWSAFGSAQPLLA